MSNAEVASIVLVSILILINIYSIISNHFKFKKIMADLTSLTADVTAEDTVVDSAITLLQGLAAQIAALAPTQAAIDALAADVTAKTQSLADAVKANTPSA